MRGRARNRHLMRSERAFDLLAIDDFWACPTLGRIEYDHWPAWALGLAVSPGILLDFLNLLDGHVERCGHCFVHQRRLMTYDEVRRPPVATEQLLQLLARNAGEKCRVRDLVAIEMQNRQHRAVD